MPEASLMFDVRIYRDGMRAETVFERSGVAGQRQQTPDRAYRDGCGWQPSLNVKVDEQWPSGGYLVELTCTDGTNKRVSHHWFAVRPTAGEGKSRVLLVCATSTGSARSSPGPNTGAMAWT